MRRGLLSTLALAFALTLTFGADALARPAPVQLSQPMPAGVSATADALAAKVREGRVPGADERDPDHGLAFLHLAATHPDPAVVAAALRGMSYTWRTEPRKGGRRQVMNPDYVAVVRARLGDADGMVRQQALRAARLPLGAATPDAQVLDAVLAMLGRPAPADRIAAVTALGNVRDFARPRPSSGPIKARVVDAVMPLLQAKEPAVIGAGLARLYRSAYPKMPQADALEGHAQRLAKHPESAVRGESLRLAVALAGDKPSESLIGRLMLGLGDQDPFVRAVSAELLAELRHRPALHRIMPLVDDEASAIRKVGGYTDLDGRPGQQRFRPESGGRVDDVALRAVDTLSEGIGSKLECAVTGRDRKKARIKARTDAKAWYAAHKDRIASAPPIAAPAPGTKAK